MKIFWKQLNRLIDLQCVNIKKLAIKLTLAGFEVNSMRYIEEIKDTVIDISITANREDITGWSQIASEVSTIVGQPLKLKSQPANVQLIQFCDTNSINLTSEMHICCMKNINLLNSNLDCIKYLRALGLATTGSILDIIQFINLKWGQRISAYELKEDSAQINYLANKTCSKKSTESKNRLKLYFASHKLSRITEGNIGLRRNAASIALINYHPKLPTDINYCLHAYSEILNLIRAKTIIKNTATLIYHYCPYMLRTKNIAFTSCSISKILGPVNNMGYKHLLDLHTITQITRSLNLYTQVIDSQATVKVPGMRNDIKEESDIAEEVARIYGFNRFYDDLPRFAGKKQLSEKYLAEKRIRHTLRSMGLHEIINYSFRPQSKNNYSLQVINPLNQEQESLRINLISGIIDAEKYNIDQGNYNFEAFEIGNVFELNKLNNSYQESTRLSCLLGNKKFNQHDWQTEATALTWLQAKGQAEEIFERINANISWSTSASKNKIIESLEHYEHPARKLYIIHLGRAIGILSQVHYLGDSADLDSYFLEIDLIELMKATKSGHSLQYIYNHYSVYPKVSRDFSITMNAKISMQEIQNIIKGIQDHKNNIIESVNIISEYYNSQYKKTICLRVTYQSKHKTLTGQEVKILDDMLKSKLSLYSRARHKPGSVLNHADQG